MPDRKQRSLFYNLPLFVSGMIFLVCVSYLIHELMDHYGFAIGLAKSKEDIHEDLNSFIAVMCLLSISGFMMLLVTFAGMIDYKRAQNELVQKNDIYKRQIAAIEASREGIAILDDNGTYSFVNSAHAKCYGFEKPQDMIGASWRSLYSADRLEYFENEIMPTVRENGWWSGPSVGRRIDGQEFTQDLSLSSIAGGGLICVVRDTTEELKNKNLLKLIKLAVEAADDGIAIADKDNKFLFMNRSYLAIHGLDPVAKDSLIGTDWREIYNEKGKENINNLILPTTILKGSWRGTLPLLRKDNQLIFADASLTSLSDGLLLGVLRDVSAQKESEDERRELSDRLFESHKIEAMMRLSKGIAADFETILAELDRNIEEKDLIKFTAKKAHELVFQLKAFSQSDEKNKGSGDVWACIEDVAQSRRQHNRKAEIICRRLSQNLISTASDTQIRQIIRNLISNAQESISGVGKVAVTAKDAERNILGLGRKIFTDGNSGRTESSRVHSETKTGRYMVYSGRLLRQKSYIQVVVSDTGRGISPEILKSIFDPFFTTKSRTKEMSSGMGLSIVHGLVIGMSGAIVIETVPGEGTTVHIFLPRPEPASVRLERAV